MSSFFFYRRLSKRIQTALMVYINTIREWQDILAIAPWTSLKELLISLFYTKLKRPDSCLNDSPWVWEKTALDALQKLLNGVVLLCIFIHAGWVKKVRKHDFLQNTFSVSYNQHYLWAVSCMAMHIWSGHCTNQQNPVQKLWKTTVYVYISC